MIRLNAAARIQQVKAAYEGTKVKDLTSYVKGLAPTVRLYKPGPGGGGGSAGLMMGVFKTSQEAAALGKALIADGWKGKKVKAKNRIAQKFPDSGHPEFVEYVLYTNENGGGFISLYKPHKDGSTRVRLNQQTNQSAYHNRPEWIKRQDRLAKYR